MTDDDLSLMDVAALGRWMDDTGLPGRGAPITYGLVTGGSQNLIFDVRRGDERYALRRPPRNPPPGRGSIMLREARIVETLAGTDVPHARFRGVCADPAVLGEPFYLMDFVENAWSPTGAKAWPSPFDSDPARRRELGISLVDGIARLAQVDYAARGLADLGKPDGFHNRQPDRWLSHLSAFRFRDIPGIDEAAAWLRTHQPARWEPGIMHGDYQFANVMFADDAPGRLAAIVDWEMGTIGDPLLDLAWVLMNWIDPDEPPEPTGYVDHTGMPTRDELVSHYADVSGRDVSWIDYYVVLARFKMAIVLEGGYARHVQGDGWSDALASFGDLVLSLARRSAELAESTKLPATTPTAPTGPR